MHTIDWKKYILAFLITSAIFGTALYASNYFNERRFAEIRSIEEKISVDILSLETQFDLFERVSCQNLKENTVLSEELGALAARLSYTEDQLGADDDEVQALKRSYSLLQIKDYVLMNKINDRCGGGPHIIVYFYSNAGDCKDCRRQGYILTALQQEFPNEIRIYAFDYNLDLGALKTLIELNNIKGDFPVLVIRDKPVYGFQDEKDILTLLPHISDLRASKKRANATSSDEY